MLPAMSGCKNNRDGLHLRLNDLSPDTTVSVTLPNNLSEDSEDEQLYYRCVPMFPEFELTSAILVSSTFLTALSFAIYTELCKCMPLKLCLQFTLSAYRIHERTLLWNSMKLNDHT